jgi:hypothetical protein
MQYTRETMPPLPAGMIRTADYGTFDRTLMADVTQIASAPAAIHGTPTAILSHVSRGYRPAGSCCLWHDKPRWSVLWTYAADNTTHGRSFADGDEAGARAYFAEITDSAKVSSIRQRAACDEDMRAEAQRRAASVPIEAAKTYRSGWQWRCPAHGLLAWCGYAKTKAAALAQGRQRIASDIYAEELAR